MRAALLLLPLLTGPLLASPLLVSRTARAAEPLLVQNTPMPAERLATLPTLDRRTTLHTGHGDETKQWSGPLLWNVLVAAGAIAADKPADHVHQSIRITATDGYIAIFSAGELSPAFAGKPIQLALQENGTPLPLPRLIVPDETRGGRSIHDIVRIDVQ